MRGRDWIEIEHQSHIGPQRLVGRHGRGEVVDGEHGFEPQPAGEALVGKRGVDVAVEEDDPAGGQRGSYDLDHELRPGGGVEERLRLGGDVVAAVQKQLPDLLPERRAPGFAQRLTGMPHVSGRQAPPYEAGAQKVDLGRLARPVDALEGHEETRVRVGRSRPHGLGAQSRAHRRHTLAGDKAGATAWSWSTSLWWDNPGPDRASTVARVRPI